MKRHKGYLLPRKINEHQDLRQEGSLMLLFCTNTVQFMISSATALIYKAAYVWPLKEKTNMVSYQSFGWTTRGAGQQEPFFLDCFYPWSFPSVFLGQCPWSRRTLCTQHWRCQSDLLILKHNVSKAASRVGSHRTFEAHSMWYCRERIINNTTEENPNRTSWRSGRITPSKVSSLLWKKLWMATSPKQ